MSCEHIQEILLSDYHDGRLSAGKRRDVNAHLQQCASCRLLAERINARVIKPFDQLSSPMPDEFCWSQIKRRIESQAVPAPRRMSWVMRPAFATASICVMLMVVGITVVRNNSGQTPYMSYVLASDTESNDEVSSSIEEYFL